MIKDRPMHILSVYETGTNNASLKDEENIKRHYALMNSLKEQGVDYQELRSSYQGVPERSLAFHGDHHLPMVRKLAQQYNQDSFLSVRPDKTAKLQYTADGREEDLGKWTQVSEAEAKRSKGYSHDQKTNTYWVAK